MTPAVTAYIELESHYFVENKSLHRLSSGLSIPCNTVPTAVLGPAFEGFFQRVDPWRAAPDVRVPFSVSLFSSC